MAGLYPNWRLIDSFVLVELEEPELRGADHAALTDIGLVLRGLPCLKEGTELLPWGLGLRHLRENRRPPGATPRVGLPVEPWRQLEVHLPDHPEGELLEEWTVFHLDVAQVLLMAEGGVCTTHLIICR